MARSVAERSCELLDRLPDAGQLTEVLPIASGNGEIGPAKLREHLHLAHVVSLQCECISVNYSVNSLKRTGFPVSADLSAANTTRCVSNAFPIFVLVSVPASRHSAKSENCSL